MRDSGRTAKNVKTIGRALAEMDYGSPPAVASALQNAIQQQQLGYLAPVDVARMQRTVNTWLHDAYGWSPGPHTIRPVADLVAGFRAVLTHFLPPGQPIIVPTPGYMPFLTLPGLIGHPVIEVPMLEEADGWQYDFAALQNAFDTGARLLVLCNPHNPIGKVTTAREMEDIEELVAANNGLVFADEIHAPLVLSTGSHLVYASRSKRAAAHTITATSASKAFNIPAAKCGQLVFTNPDHLELWLSVGHWYEHQTSKLGVIATETAYKDGCAWLTKVVQRLNDIITQTVDLLEASAEQTGIRVIRPEATYLLWLDLRGTGLIRADESAAEALLRTAQLVTTDGASCGAVGQGWVRLNVAMSEETTMEGVRRMIAAATIAKGSQQ